MISYFDPATDTDFGTPARESEVQVSLNIDGRSISVPAGTSVMRAAAMLGTSIPKLCATDSVEAFGSCRLCVVEIEGRRGTPASCTTPVADGASCNFEGPVTAEADFGTDGKITFTRLADGSTEVTLALNSSLTGVAAFLAAELTDSPILKE